MTYTVPGGALNSTQTKPLHYLVKYECQKNGGKYVLSLMIIANSVAKHLSWDGLLHYKFIIQFAGEITFEIGEHLAKLQFFPTIVQLLTTFRLT